MEDCTNSTRDSKSAIETGDNWQRLAPISILYFTASNVKKLAQFLIYVIPALAISSNVFEMHNSTYAIAIGVGILLTMSVSGLISYFFYSFRIHHQHVEVKCGVLSRRHINLPFWRIQNVKVEQPFYYRPFHFALVILDTAGSSEEEAKIVAVPLAYAKTLRTQILADKTDAENIGGDTTEHPRLSPDINEEVVNRRSIKDLVIHGITNNRVWILLGVAAPFYDNLSTFMINWLESKGLGLEQLVGEQSASWWQLGLYTLTAVMIIMALLALLSVGGTLLTFYDYTLSRDNDRYIRRSGLLSKQEVSMKQSRIQVVTAKQDWLDKILQRVNLYFEQNTAGIQRQTELMSPTKLLVPSVSIEQAQHLAAQALPGSQLYNLSYKAVSKRFLWHWLGVWVWPPALTLSFFSAAQLEWVEALAVVFLGLVVTVTFLLRWQRWGYCTDAGYLYTRSGIVGVDHQCFDMFKVQQVTVQQSIFMARNKVATLKVVLASGRISIPFMPEQDAWAFANLMLYNAESSQRSWM